MEIDVRGKKVSLTGTFAGVKRAVAEAGLVARGAVVSGSVGNKTDLVFAGADAGSKLEKARGLGIPVHDEAALLAVITGQTQITPSNTHPFHAGFDRLIARATSWDPQPDGRTLMRIERAEGGRQLAFLRADERDTIERALEARRA